MSKDTGLTQFLPAIRAVMETILLRVKSIIVINNCADAFFMGSMKNRDLKGQEIPSQVSNVHIYLKLTPISIYIETPSIALRNKKVMSKKKDWD